MLLEPDEHFTVISLSGGKPKVEALIKSLALQLGPDFMQDDLTVETSDHAKLNLELTYNWHFEFDRANPADFTKMFSVRDFVGDACKTIASRIRGAISAITFEDFHYHSTIKIKEAVFGKDAATGEIKKSLTFRKSNLLSITSVDIHNIEIADPKTRAYLSRSINLSIEIQTKSQEAKSQHQAERLEQESKGQLQIDKYKADAEAEFKKIDLLKLQAESNYVRIKGDAVSKAKAIAETQMIKEKQNVENAKLQADKIKIESENRLARLKAEHELNLQEKKDLNAIEIDK